VFYAIHGFGFSPLIEQGVITPLQSNIFMHTKHNSLRKKRTSERGRRMSNARWAADRERRDAEEPERVREIAEIDAINLPRKKGDVLGCLQWTDARTGKIRRWIIRIGDRSDRITAELPGMKPSKPHGWTWALNHLRPFLCGNK
jgi:hypothetical protein